MELIHIKGYFVITMKIVFQLFLVFLNHIQKNLNIGLIALILQFTMDMEEQPALISLETIYIFMLVIY